MRSIRGRLQLGLLAGMLLVLIAASALVFMAALDEVGELFDYQLEQTATAFSAQPLKTPDKLPDKDDDDPEADFAIQVWDAAGAPQFSSPSPAALPRVARPGFSDLEAGGERWRVFSTDSGGRTVQVAQPWQVRNAVASGIALRMLALVLLLFPLAALLIWLTVGRGLRPLDAVAADLQRRSHLDLRPLDTQRLPREIEPLANSLNDLLARLGRVITAQKVFVADAAHELLTPITALQLQAQLLSRADDEPSRQEALAELHQGLARTVHTARQLLTLARQESGHAGAGQALLDLRELVRQVIRTELPLAEARDIRLETRAPAEALLRGDAAALATLFSSLLNNAIKYTPRGGEVRVSVEQDEAGTALLLEDSGPGIPPEDRERVFDRFFRRPGTETFGSGLGLAIARDIAVRHRAEIELSASVELGGLAACVRFPA